MFSPKSLSIFLALLLFFTGSRAAVAAERLHVEYRVSYRLGVFKLLDIARVHLRLREDSFTPRGQTKAVPVLVLELDVKPIKDNPKKTKRRVFFDSHYETISDLESFHILFYRKRIHEDIDLPVVRSKKDYLEEVIYEPSKAYVKRQDFLAETNEETEVDLTKFKPDAPMGGEVFDLTTLMGRALFQPGYFKSLREFNKPMAAQIVTKTRLYQFKFHTEKSHIRSPLTGRVKATKVESDVMFRSLKSEVVPFEAWLTAPEDVSKDLREKMLAAGLYSFPTAFKLKFTVGSLAVAAEKFETPEASQTPPSEVK